jgi:uncharacterized membrane protein
MEFQSLMEAVGKAVDVVGVAVIVLGAIAATVLVGWRLVRREPSFRPYRQQLGRSILLGLESWVSDARIRKMLSP